MDTVKTPTKSFMGFGAPNAQNGKWSKWMHACTHIGWQHYVYAHSCHTPINFTMPSSTFTSLVIQLIRCTHAQYSTQVAGTDDLVASHFIGLVINIPLVKIEYIIQYMRAVCKLWKQTRFPMYVSHIYTNFWLPVWTTGCGAIPISYNCTPWLNGKGLLPLQAEPCRHTSATMAWRSWRHWALHYLYGHRCMVFTDH